MRLHALQSDVAALSLDDDQDVTRDLAVNDLVRATSTLRSLPPIRGQEELLDLKLVVAELTRYVRSAEGAS